MKILVAIPSKGRAKSIMNRTMRWVSRTGYDVRVFVEPQEILEYREAAVHANYEHYLDIKPEQFVDIKQSDKGLGYVKSFIGQYAELNGYDLVFKMDDDVLRFNGRGKNKPDDEMILDFAAMVGKCRVTFGKYPDVAAIGFPYRNELYEPKEWAGINYRLQSCYMIRTEYIQGGFSSFEDFAQYIYIRSQNKVTLRYGLMGIDAADVGKNPGGCQAFDRSDQAKEELPRLRKMYPALKFKKVEGKAWDTEPVLSGKFFGIIKL